MKIDTQITPDVVRAAVKRVADQGASPSRRPATISRSDSVELSAESRAFGADAPLSADRIATIRERISNGGYDAAHVADVVARRIIESGDL